MAFGLSDILGVLGKPVVKYGGKALKSSFFSGKPEEFGQQPRYTPEQEDIMNQLMQQGMGNMDFGNIEQLEQKRFQEQTIPSIAERFTGMGAGGQRSSAFQGALGRAGSDLGTRLGGLRAGFGGQQLGMGLQPRFDTTYKPETEGFGGQALQMLMKLLPLLAGM